MEDNNPYKTPAVAPAARTCRRFRQFWPVVIYLALLTPLVMAGLSFTSSTIEDEPVASWIGPLLAFVASIAVLVVGVVAYVVGAAYVIQTTYWLPWANDE